MSTKGAIAKFFLASVFLFLAHAAWADEPPSDQGDDSAASTASDKGEMKETGGFVNMKPATDYDAPEPQRDPSSDNDDGDKSDGGD